MYRNIMITMVLGGLWHGAAWTFVAWGGLHGIGQCAGHYRRAKRVEHGLSPQREGRWWVAWERFATFQLVCVGLGLLPGHLVRECLCRFRAALHRLDAGRPRS